MGEADYLLRVSRADDTSHLGGVSLLANISLAGIKLLVGFFGNSFALIADGIESLADVVSSAIVWTGLRISQKEADYEHPYGHGKAEAIAALLASVGLLISAGIIALNAVREIVSPQNAPALFTVPVLVGIILVKEWLYRVLTKANEDADSVALKAEAWHHRSDSLTSLGVLIGIAIAIFAGPGYEAGDDIAALLVTVLIVYNAFRIARPALDELMDSRVEGHQVARVSELADSIVGIERLETVMIRRTGRSFAAEIHMEVAPDMSVKEGHRISHELKEVLIEDSGLGLAHVVVHVEPCKQLDGA